MINICVFCTKDDYILVRETIEHYNKNGNFNLSIYCPENDLNILKKTLSGTGIFDLKSDYEIDKNGAFLEIIKSWSSEGTVNNPGWCYQQYLKLRLVENSDDLLVIMDGDTYVDPSYLDNCIKNKIVSSTLENIFIYNDILSKIDLKIKLRDISYISNFGIISADLFRMNINSVDDLFYKIYHYCVKNEKIFIISEYQLFGNIMLNNGWNSNFLKIFRRVDLLPINFFGIQRILYASNLLGFNALAVEQKHSKNIFNRIIAPILFLLGYSW
jgi:hypothetical protein